MRRYLFFFLLLFQQHLLSAQVFSNNELFREGNALYKQGNYESAIEHYKNIIEAGVVNGYLFYNIANAYFKTGRIGYAILYYEKALKFLPRDKELIENLRFVKTYTQEKIEEKKPPFILLIFYWILNKFSLKEVTIAVSTIFSLTILCAIIFISKKTVLLIKNLTVSLFVIFLFSFFLLSLKFNIINTRRGVIVKDVANVKSAPSDDATLEFVIHEGADFQILETLKGWTKIKLSDGKTGWLVSETFEQI